MDPYKPTIFPITPKPESNMPPNEPKEKMGGLSTIEQVVMQPRKGRMLIKRVPLNKPLRDGGRELINNPVGPPRIKTTSQDGNSLVPG